MTNLPNIENMKKIEVLESAPNSPAPTVQTSQSAPSGESGFYAFPQKTLKKFNLNKKVLGSLGAGLLVLLAVVAFFLVVPLLSIRISAKRVAGSGNELKSAIDQQNLGQIKASLAKTKKDLSSVESDLNKLAWVKIIPFANGYWNDAKHASVGGKAGLEAGEIIVQAVEPYADILGFNGGAQAQDGAKTAEDRINFIVETVDQLIPQLDNISAKTGKMASELSQIDPNRYPVHFKGQELRSKIKGGIEAAEEANALVTNGKPVLRELPYLLGINSERTYLFLFQNDKELRPTGGFLTAYSIIKVKDGKFSPATSNDIYNLDSRLKNKPPAPEPIKKYLPLVNVWNLRDMNLSPDFKTSMDTFSEYYAQTKAPAYDGIVAMDTKLLVDILAVIGRIGVPGFGNFSSEPDTRCNCPNVIYELESYADVAGPIVWDDISGKIVFKPANADNRKLILGPLMNSVLSNALGQPKEKLPGLFEAGFKAVREKHVMFYFGENETQKAMEAFNIAGRLRDNNGGDYLHINDANFAGAKANLYVEQQVELEVKTAKDGTTNTLTIKYKNPQKHDGWLNGPYRDWFRVYVPKGSTLVDAQGSEVPVSTSEDLGKTVFDGFFTLRAEGVTEIKIEYKTPVKGEYKLLVQKQPGTEANLYTVKVGKQKEEFLLKMDKELKF